MGPLLGLAGFTTVVLCAEEFQPPAVLPPLWEPALRPVLQGLSNIPYAGVEVIYAPNDDSFERPPTRDQLALAVKASGIAADRVRNGGNVLITCMQGRNRSGLVSALTLHRLLGVSGFQAVEMVQRRRAPVPALTNPHFVSVLYNVKPSGAQKVSRPVY